MELIEKKNDFILRDNRGNEHHVSKKHYFLLKHILENKGKVMETEKLAGKFRISSATLRNYLTKFRKVYGMRIRRVTGFVFDD